MSGLKQVPRKAKQTCKGKSNMTHANLNRCFICGDREHYLAACPLRHHRSSIFCQGCGKYGHVEGTGCLAGRKRSSETHVKEQKLNSQARPPLAQNPIPTRRSRVLSPYARRSAGLKAYIAQVNGCSLTLELKGNC